MHSHPLWSIGFRPFFLLSGIASVLLIFIWGGLFQHGIFPHNYYPPINWHGHEMLFGYTVGVLSGFLLTSVGNWTGKITAHGYTLAGLALLWLLGRLAPFAGNLVPAPLIAFIDLAFLPCLTVYLTIPIWQQRKYRNLSFIALLLCLFVANLFFHLDAMGITDVDTSKLFSFIIYIILAFVSLIAGRVIPFFTQRGLTGAMPVTWPLIEKISVLSIFGLMILKPLYFGSTIFIICSIIALLANTVRLTGWYCKGIHKVPLLWVLHLGYLWMIVGISLEILSVFDIVPPQLALHALTAGCIGTLTLGMMSRVALGHTGRPIKANKIIAFSFILLNIAVCFRVIAPLFSPINYIHWVTTSSGLWVLAFLIFALYFTPILLKKRADE